MPTSKNNADDKLRYTRIQEELIALEKESKYPNTLERGKSVEAYLKGDGSYASIGETRGVNKATLSRWVNTYRTLGIYGLKSMETHNTYKSRQI